MPALILEKLCRGCQRCIRICPNSAITMTSYLPIIDPEKCQDCEECLEACMHGAITFRSYEKEEGNGQTRIS